MRSGRLVCACAALAVLAVLVAAAPVHARVIEQQMEVPVQVRNAWGKPVAQDIRVTVFYDDQVPAPRPVLLLNHGRATDAAGRAALGRARYSEISRWFAAHGFLVAVPTRAGYGVSGGEDVEDSGDCSARRYEPVYRAAAEQSLSVLEAVYARDDARRDRTVLIGQSFGGATTVALAARNPRGVVAAINVSGGGGGDPKGHPGEPCSPARMEQLLAGYGSSAQVPMLWMYAENDLFFGARYPRQWVQAFRAAGGQAEFQQFPPSGEDGHQLFTRFAPVWQPVVADYLRRQGFDFKD